MRGVAALLAAIVGAVIVGYAFAMAGGYIGALIYGFEGWGLGGATGIPGAIIGFGVGIWLVMRRATRSTGEVLD